MNLTYCEHANWNLPHWVDTEFTQPEDNLLQIMDVNQWIVDKLGELGKRWGYERQQIVLPYPTGLNPVKVSMFYTRIHYSWRFLNKDDAMLFKLTWGGR